ncbi:contractile injection system tape measure protein [Spartinivicinus poritis]|uniref:Contractile injection system tape measure protein n=1 Tax=Spartinivicinus poritis TaxID=2994640 RepID=A0ABT5UF79_9GAMM|nr:contractile injection system tape measure protein [Spartinivicinus sp. A2-2]MDE1465035.1 contractile injection system tape measure protein [Spartinivicinus sp. A2-2]
MSSIAVQQCVIEIAVNRKENKDRVKRITESIVRHFFNSYQLNDSESLLSKEDIYIENIYIDIEEINLSKLKYDLHKALLFSLKNELLKRLSAISATPDYQFNKIITILLLEKNITSYKIEFLLKILQHKHKNHTEVVLSLLKSAIFVHKKSNKKELLLNIFKNTMYKDTDVETRNLNEILSLYTKFNNNKKTSNKSYIINIQKEIQFGETALKWLEIIEQYRLDLSSVENMIQVINMWAKKYGIISPFIKGVLQKINNIPNIKQTISLTDFYALDKANEKSKNSLSKLKHYKQIAENLIKQIPSKNSIYFMDLTPSLINIKNIHLDLVNLIILTKNIADSITKKDEEINIGKIINNILSIKNTIEKKSFSDQKKYDVLIDIIKRIKLLSSKKYQNKHTQNLYKNISELANNIIILNSNSMTKNKVYIICKILGDIKKYNTKKSRAKINIKHIDTISNSNEEIIELRDILKNISIDITSIKKYLEDISNIYYIPLSLNNKITSIIKNIINNDSYIAAIENIYNELLLLKISNLDHIHYKQESIIARKIIKEIKNQEVRTIEHIIHKKILEKNIVYKNDLSKYLYILTLGITSKQYHKRQPTEKELTKYNKIISKYKIEKIPFFGKNIITKIINIHHSIISMLNNTDMEIYYIQEINKELTNSTGEKLPSILKKWGMVLPEKIVNTININPKGIQDISNILRIIQDEKKHLTLKKNILLKNLVNISYFQENLISFLLQTNIDNYKVTLENIPKEHIDNLFIIIKNSTISERYKDELNKGLETINLIHNQPHDQLENNKIISLFNSNQYLNILNYIKDICKHILDKILNSIKNYLDKNKNIIFSNYIKSTSNNESFLRTKENIKMIIASLVSSIKNNYNYIYSNSKRNIGTETKINLGIIIKNTIENILSISINFEKDLNFIDQLYDAIFPRENEVFIKIKKNQDPVLDILISFYMKKIKTNQYLKSELYKSLLELEDNTNTKKTINTTSLLKNTALINNKINTVSDDYRIKSKDIYEIVQVFDRIKTVNDNNLTPLNNREDIYINSHKFDDNSLMPLNNRKDIYIDPHTSLTKDQYKKEYLGKSSNIENSNFFDQEKNINPLTNISHNFNGSNEIIHKQVIDDLRNKLLNYTNNLQKIEYKENILIPTNDAGILLLWPYFKDIFINTNLLDEQFKFKEEKSIIKAYSMLKTAFNSKYEYSLITINLVLGLSPETIIFDNDINLSDIELNTINDTILALIYRFKYFNNISVETFKDLFIQRNGFINKIGVGWKTTIERKAQDILIDKLPWQINSIKLPWLEYEITTEWK